jgi:hypothetical protein
MGARRDFSKNIHASRFNDDLLNKPNFGRIHLAGQYTFKRYTSNCLHATSPRCVRAASGFFQIFCHATNWLQVGYNKKLGDGWYWNL